MALHPNELEIFRQHITRMPMGGCPVCRSTEWVLSGLYSAISARQGFNHDPKLPPPNNRAPFFFLPNDTEVAPFVTLTCATCAFQLHFAWLPILNAHYAKQRSEIEAAAASDKGASNA